MSVCKKLCLFCSSSQTYKINFTLSHGICLEHYLNCMFHVLKYTQLFLVHYSNLSEYSECSHCSSLIPITLMTQLFPCQNCKKPKTFSKLSHSDQLCKSCITPNPTKQLFAPNQNLSKTISKETCEYCRKTAELVTQQCSHKMCSECVSAVCYICSLEESQRASQKTEFCECCLTSPSTACLDCGHVLCQNCSKDVCGICAIHSRTPSLFGVCELCFSKAGVESCSKGHRACMDCFSSTCSKCSTVSMDVCEVCEANKLYGMCENNHKVCFECSKHCELCRIQSENRKFSMGIKSDTGLNENFSSSRNKSDSLCYYCGKNKGCIGNHCSHMFCKDCISHHKRICSNNESGDLDLSYSKSCYSEKEEIIIGGNKEISNLEEIQRISAKYTVSKSMGSRNSSKASRPKDTQCKCLII